MAYVSGKTASASTKFGFLVSAVLAGAFAAVTCPVAAEEFPIVKVAAPKINCLANLECAVAVTDSISALGEGAPSEFGFLQSRSVPAQANAPAAGYTMIQYRLHLVNAEKRRNGPCVTQIKLRSAAPAFEFDIDGKGRRERAVFAITQGGLGTIVPRFARYESGIMTIEFAEGICPPGSRKGRAKENGETSVFFGWFAQGEPRPSASRILLGDQSKVLVAARAPAPAIERITYRVDGELSKLRLSAPGLLKGQTRETEIVRGKDGKLHHFASGEIVLSTQDPAKLHAFLSKYKGQILRSFDPRNFGAKEGPITYHIGLDPKTLKVATEDLAEHLVALGYQGGGSFTISSEPGLRLLTLVAGEARRGLEIDVDWVFKSRQFRGVATQEAVNFGATIPGFSYSRNAYTWPTHSKGSNQDIGVGEAWTMLARVDRLRPTVKLGVIDLGFAFTADQPWATADTLDNIDPLATNFTSGSAAATFCGVFCNHGTNVASVFAAIPANGIGAAGPAGPVASEIVYIAVVVNTRTSLLGGLQIAHEHGVGIVNMSFSGERWEPWAWNAGLTEGISRFTRALDRQGMLLVASAGNDGAEGTGGLFGDFHHPCQNNGVLCVGGVAFDSLDRHPNSNFGSGVAIYGPFVTFAGPSPSPSSPTLDNDTITAFMGTSGASPFVAGVAALVRAADPTLTPAQVREILIRTAKQRPDPFVPGLTNQIVDAHAAVAAALVGSGTVPLTARIRRPIGGESISAGNVSVTLLADVFSLFDITPSVTWTSDVEGALGTGSFAPHIFRRTGTQTITMVASDSRGNVVTDRVSVVIVDDPPIVMIDHPREGQRFRRNESITLRGWARDPNQIRIDGGRIGDAQLRWTLDDGTMFTGGTVTLGANLLPEGPAQIRFTATDGTLETTAQVGIIIEPPASGNPPSVRILNPETGFSAYVNRQDPSSRNWVLDLDLRGRASDPEDGMLSGASLRWFATGPDGIRRPLGEGENLSVSLESRQPFGTSYLIELEALDSTGNLVSDAVRVLVQTLS